MEARDWRSISDPALSWLAKYTYENLDKWPGSEIIQSLQERFPADAGVIYRGINFYTQDEHDKFMSQFGDARETDMLFGGVTSWTRSERGAEQFAITQPTYFLNREVMVAHGRMRDERERLAGYRGLILGMHLPAQVGIDVDASGVGHESEIVVPPGTYHIFIHRVIKKYADQLRDADTTVDRVILQTTRADLSTTQTNASFLDHVLHHHLDKLSPQARAHLFKLYAPDPSLPAFRYSVEPTYKFGEHEPDTVEFHHGIPALRLFRLYKRGAFTDPRQEKAIVALARRAVKQALPIIRDNIVQARRCDLSDVQLAADIAGMSTDLSAVIRNTIGAEYRRLETQGREINNIKDARERQRAIERHTERLTSLLSKIPGSGRR